MVQSSGIHRCPLDMSNCSMTYIYIELSRTSHTDLTQRLSIRCLLSDIVHSLHNPNSFTQSRGSPVRTWSSLRHMFFLLEPGTDSLATVLCAQQANDNCRIELRLAASFLPTTAPKVVRGMGLSLCSLDNLAILRRHLTVFSIHSLPSTAQQLISPCMALSKFHPQFSRL